MRSTAIGGAVYSERASRLGGRTSNVGKSIGAGGSTGVSQYGHTCQSASSGALQFAHACFSFVVQTGQTRNSFDLRAADRAVEVAAGEPLLHRLDLELPLAHVLEVLRRPEEHVDERADVGRDQPDRDRVAISHGSSIRRLASL